MASINLAGAIGLGGKRESIISGLPDAINKAGDALNKTIGDELKRQEGERAAKREKELQIKEQLSKQVRSTIGEGEMSDPDKARINERGLDAMSKAYSVYTDPNISWAEKENIKNKLFSDLEKEAMFYRKDYEDFKNTMGFINKPENKNIIDFNKVDDFVKGDYGSREEKITMDDKAFSADSTEEEVTNTVITPNFPNQQGTPYFNIPYEERVKIAPNNFGEVANELIHVKAGDEIKAVKEFIRAEPSVFVKETTTDGNTKFTIKQDEIDKERTLLKAGMEDPATLPLETYKLFNNFYDRRYKELLGRRFPKEQAIKSAKELASQDMLNNFDKVINRGIEEATNKPKINNEGGGKGLTINNGIVSNNKWGISNEPIKIDAIDNLLTPDQEEKIADRVTAKYGKKANPKDIEILTQAEIKKEKEKILKSKDLGFVAVQTIATGGNPIQPFRVGKGVSDGVYIDTKTNKILGFRVAQLNSDGTEGEITFEKATPELVLSFKTNLGNDKAGKNLWESRYSEKSVSSQKVSDKKVETQTSFYKPRQELKANEIDVKKLKPNEVYIVDGIERVYIDGQLKKVKKKLKNNGTRK